MNSRDYLCRVCLTAATAFFMEVSLRRYRRCPACGATLLELTELPDAATEYARYLHHQNDPADQGYRSFLARLLVPLLKRLPAAASGLDYGCGPGPALAAMLKEAGHTVQLYDPFFYPNFAPLQQQYDFITCTEVVEHFHHPAGELKRLHALLRPGGWLGIMTCFQTSDDQFANWHYRRDDTHVVFYKETTFYYLARQLEMTCEIPCPNVVLMRKPSERFASHSLTKGTCYVNSD